MLFVTFAMKGQESAIIGIAELNQRTGSREQRRRLIVMPIECAKHPVKARNADGNPGPRACGVFDDAARRIRLTHTAARKVRLANAAHKRKPRGDSEVVLCPSLGQAAIRRAMLSEIRAGRGGRITN